MSVTASDRRPGVRLLGRSPGWHPLLLVPALLLPGCGPASETGEASEIGGGDGMVELTSEQLASAGIELREVVLDSMAIPLRIPGSLAPPDTAVTGVGSVVEGQVTRIWVVAGEEVRRGAPLLRIRSHELTDAERDRTGARAREGYARSALERSEALLEAGAVSREEVERRRADHEEALAERVRSEAWLGLLDPSENGEVTVRAPRDGMIFDVKVAPGSAVTPGTPLLELGGMETLWITAFVPERIVAEVAPGAPVEVILDAFPEVTVPARVVRLGGRVDPVRRALEIRAELLEPPLGARAGMFASLLLPLGERTSRMILPSEAVQRMEEGEIVFLEEGSGRFRMHPVTATPLGGGRVAVEGLPVGARVVVEGAYVLRSTAAEIEVDD